jgi:hypothetical protein
MARANIPTLLPLDTYAQIMGLNPLHFNGARLPQVTPEPLTVAPDWSERPIWQQFGWQNTSIISRDHLARTIQQAEFDIAKFLGYWPAPQWASQEVHRYPRPNRPEFYGSGLNVRGQLKEIKADFAKIIAVGPRAVGDAVVATEGVELIFSDPNLDGWNTLATITVATDITDECEVRVYFANQNGDPAWEIRPLKSVSIAGNVATITIDSWLLFDPDVTNAFPTGEVTSIDASVAANYVTSVEVRREYTNSIATNVTFYWEREPGTALNVPVLCCPVCDSAGCEACTLITLNGCMAIRDAENGILAPAPATYDAVDDIRWEKVSWAQCREPDQLKIWYYSGLQSEYGLRGSCDKLDSAMARTIAVLATARLGWGFRAESGVSSVIDFWQRDQAESFPDGSTIFTPPSILDNPFGTRRGEVATYRSLNHMRERKLSVGVVAA